MTRDINLLQFWCGSLHPHRKWITKFKTMLECCLQSFFIKSVYFSMKILMMVKLSSNRITWKFFDVSMILCIMNSSEWSSQIICRLFQKFFPGSLWQNIGLCKCSILSGSCSLKLLPKLKIYLKKFDDMVDIKKKWLQLQTVEVWDIYSGIWKYVVISLVL